MAADLVFPPAAQPDIIRALQKDEVYVRVSCDRGGISHFKSGVPSHLLQSCVLCVRTPPRPGSYPAALGRSVDIRVTGTSPRVHFHIPLARQREGPAKLRGNLPTESRLARLRHMLAVTRRPRALSAH